MADFRVTCVDKLSNVHEGITHLGGYGWRSTRGEVIVAIENRTNTFYTFEDGKRAEVLVRQGPHGKYLQTCADGSWNNNLLALNACPIR